MSHYAASTGEDRAGDRRVGATGRHREGRDQQREGEGTQQVDQGERAEGRVIANSGRLDPRVQQEARRTADDHRVPEGGKRRYPAAVRELPQLIDYKVPTSPFAEPGSVLARCLTCAALEFGHYRGVGESCGVAKIATFGDVAQQSAHDLAATGLW